METSSLYPQERHQAISQEKDLTVADHDKDIDVLNNLIGQTLDSAECYKEAAEWEETHRFDQLFIKRHQERDGIVEMLQNRVRALGGDPKDRPTILGAMKRTWTIFIGKTTQDDDGLISRIESREDGLRDDYMEALEEDLTPETHALIQKAFESVKSGHAEMVALKAAVAD